MLCQNIFLEIIFIMMIFSRIYFYNDVFLAISHIQQRSLNYTGVWNKYEYNEQKSKFLYKFIYLLYNV